MHVHMRKAEIHHNESGPFNFGSLDPRLHMKDLDRHKLNGRPNEETRR